MTVDIEDPMLSLRKSEESFRQVVEAAPNAMVMVNRDGLIELVNTQTERVFGYTRQELLGQPVEVLVPERFRGQHPGLRRGFLGAPLSRPMGAGRDLYGLRKDGSEVPIEIGLNPIETNEGMKVLSSIVDISDRKQREERIHAALREKDILLGEIHHRVKNNLQIVSSLLDLQSARVNDIAVIDMLKDSQNRIRSMALIHQTLYQSKDFAKVDFSSFLDALVPTLISSYRVDSQRVLLEVDAGSVQLPISAAIPCGLLMNELISNTLKHAFPQGRQGKITIDLSSDGEGWVTLAVSDDGVGIPEHLDITESETLGLTLVSLLNDQLGGRMTVHRANPTAFTFHFPMHR